MSALGPENAYIFRITHIDNVPWILTNGLHCQNSKISDPNFRAIGSIGLIEARKTREVPIYPGGMLSDYVPFYFTPWSPMALRIKTGYNVQQVPNSEIVILVSSLHQVNDEGIEFVFTDGHAYYETANFYSELSDLSKVDWALLRRRDFKKNDPEDPGKHERYQAEALIHLHLPITALRGLACHDPTVQRQLQAAVDGHGLHLKVMSKPDWYF